MVTFLMAFLMIRNFCSNQIQMVAFPWITATPINTRLRLGSLWVMRNFYFLVTFPENEPKVHIEHVLPDREFWSQSITNLRNFLKVCILTELLGNCCACFSTCSAIAGTDSKPSELPDASIAPDHFTASDMSETGLSITSLYLPCLKQD